MLASADNNMANAVSPAARAVRVHAACIGVLALLAASMLGMLPFAALPWVEGAGAALLGLALGLPLWWLPINALFFPAAHALLTLQLAPSYYLGALCLLMLFNIGAWRTRVPLFLSSRRAAAVVAALLPRTRGFRLLDIGCGTGSFLFDVARVRPDGRYSGVEIAPLPYLLGGLRACGRRNLRIQWGDFWQRDLASYDVVYAYLSPAPMAQLWQKARAEMRPGALFISNDFCVPGVPPTEIIRVGDRMHSTIYVWKM